MPLGDADGFGDGNGDETIGRLDAGDAADWSVVAVGLGGAAAERGEREGVFDSASLVVESVCFVGGRFASCPPEGVGAGQKTSRPYKQKIIAAT